MRGRDGEVMLWHRRMSRAGVLVSQTLDMASLTWHSKLGKDRIGLAGGGGMDAVPRPPFRHAYCSCLLLLLHFLLQLLLLLLIQLLLLLLLLLLSYCFLAAGPPDFFLNSFILSRLSVPP